MPEGRRAAANAAIKAPEQPGLFTPGTSNVLLRSSAIKAPEVTKVSHFMVMTGLADGCVAPWGSGSDLKHQNGSSGVKSDHSRPTKHGPRTPTRGTRLIARPGPPLSPWTWPLYMPCTTPIKIPVSIANWVAPCRMSQAGEVCNQCVPWVCGCIHSGSGKISLAIG